MIKLSVHEAKAGFSALLKQVEAGEVVQITRHDKPVAEVRRVTSERKLPVLGAFAQPGTPPLEVVCTDDEITELFNGTDS